MKKLSSLIFGLIFFVVGILIFLAGLNEEKNKKEFMKTAEKVEGVISNIQSYSRYNSSKKRNETHHDVYVTYEVDGIKYENINLSYYSSNMYVGKNINVYYNPLNPADIRVKEADRFTLLITSFMGGLFALVGLIAMSTSIKRTSKLKKTGKRLEGMVIAVECNTRISVNGQHPFKVTCRVEDYSRGEAYVYKSKNVYIDLYQYNLETVPVYIDPNNPAKFYVDVEEGVNRCINQAYDNGMPIREFE